MSEGYVFVVDNYDSFTYNLVDCIQRMGCKVRVQYSDRVTCEEVCSNLPDLFLISPGPGRPETSGRCLEILRKLPKEVPVLGVCLGHQILAYFTGADIIQAPELCHGKIRFVHHKGTPLYKGIPTPFETTRYHSLAVDAGSLPSEWDVTGFADDGTIMVIEHREKPWVGFQFHPESICTRYGPVLLSNFFQVYTHIAISPLEPWRVSVADLNKIRTEGKLYENRRSMK